MRVGVLGGTFDPIHLGHLALAQAALACARLDRVVLVPAGRPPHRDAAHASAADRLEMARLAAAGRPGLEVSPLEVERPGPSFTADTLRSLRAQRPGDGLVLVLGWDAARELRTWHDPDAVLRLAQLLVLPRPGLQPPSARDLAQAGLDPGDTVLCDDSTPAIDATEIRRLAAAGESLAGLVDPEVEDYIRRRRLYTDRQLQVDRTGQD